MKHRLIALSCIFLSVIFGFSCRIVVGKAESTRLTFAVKTAGPAARSASRVILASLTASIRLRVAEADGTERAVTVAFVSGTTAVSMTALPATVPLDIYVESLDSSGTVLTSWHARETLSPGSNSFTATLVPAAPVNAIDGSSLPASGPVATLARNGLRCDSFSGLTPSAEVQFIYDTDKAEYAHLRAYDSSWNALAPVAIDENEGWTVVAVPPDGMVNTLCSNDSSSADYPAREITGFTQARQAVFIAQSAAGAGTSASPGDFVSNVSAGSGRSFFLRQGTYTLAAPLSFMNVDFQFYGGFGSGGWSARSRVDYPTTIDYPSSSNAQYMIDIAGTTRGRIDGCSILGSNIVNSGSATATALRIGSSRTFILKDCSVSSTLSSMTYGSAVSTAALLVASGSPEIAGCELYGGTVSPNTAGATVRALWISGAAPHPYVHGCYLNAGNINGAGPGSSYGIDVAASANLTLSGCRVWGGISRATGGNTTYAFGLGQSGSGSVLAANSILSGGYATSSTGSSHTRGLEIGSSSSATAVGCVIDGGFSSSSTRTDFSVHLPMSTTVDTSSCISGCVILCSCTFSTSFTDYVVGVYQEQGLPPHYIARLSGNVFFACRGAGLSGPPLDRPFDDLYALAGGNNAGDTSALATAEFLSYPAASNTIVDSSHFTSVDWRPSASAVYAGSPSAEGPAAWGIADAAFGQYPALAFDLSGRIRPATWARGAYER